MFIIVNGKMYPLPESRTLDELLRALAPPAPFAVAHNEEFVARRTYGECLIAPGDRIDVVHPTAGG